MRLRAGYEAWARWVHGCGGALFRVAELRAHCLAGQDSLWHAKTAGRGAVRRMAEPVLSGGTTCPEGLIQLFRIDVVVLCWNIREVGVFRIEVVVDCIVLFGLVLGVVRRVRVLIRQLSLKCM